jgi:tetratricopeptide (TPR) repeat protein
MDPANAIAALDDAADREQVFVLLLRAARSRTRFAALLTVHADQIRGRRALATDAFDTSVVAKLEIPRGSVPAFEEVVETGAPYIGPIATGEPFVDGCLEQLGGMVPASALVLPLTVGGRTAAIMVAHRGTGEIAADEVEDLFPLVTAMAPALGRIVASRSAAATQTEGRRASTIDAGVDDIATQRQAIEAHRTAGEWEELAESLRAFIRFGMERGVPDEDEQLKLLVELGKVESERLGRTDLAIEAWQSALTIDASDARVHDALAAQYARDGRWADVAELLERRIALLELPNHRVARLVELAGVAREHLHDPPREREVWERVMAWDSTHEEASQRLEALYTAAEAWEPLVALLIERASRHLDARTRVAALETVAQLYESKLDDARAAALVWVTVLRREPGRARVVDELRRLAPIADAWDELVPECEKLAKELEVQSPGAAARLWRLVARWKLDHTGNRDEAGDALARAARAAPDDPYVLSDQLSLLRVAGPWVELAAALARRAEVEPAPQLRAELFAELGDVYAHKLAQPVEAIAAYERAVADDPRSTAPLAALRSLYRSVEAWEELVGVLPRLADALGADATAEELVELHVELAEIHARAGNADDAVRAYKEALELVPGHAVALAGLEAVYASTGQQVALLDAREAQIDRAAPSAGDRFAELGAAWERAGVFARAAAAWRLAIELRTASVDTHAAYAALFRALRADRQWDALVAAYRARLTLGADGPTRGAMLVELAEVLADQGDVDGAVTACDEALRAAPDDPPTLDGIARLHERAGRWKSAVVVLERRLAAATDAVARADVLQRIGHVHASASDPVRARVSLEQAIALDPDNASAHEGMARVHLAEDDLPLAGEAMQRAAQRYADPVDRIRCLADAAWLYRERVKDPEKARACLEAVLALDADNADAKRALADLLHGAEQWHTLWPHLEQEVRAAIDDPAMPPAEKHDLFARAARCALELGKFPAALELYDRACTADPTTATLLDRAEALRRSGTPEAAAASYQTLLVQRGGQLAPAEQVRVYRALAQIHHGLGKPAQAQMFHQKVLDVDHADRATLLDLAALHAELERFDEAIATLRTLAEVTPARDRSPIRERIGDIYRNKLQNPARAASSYLQALESDPANHRVLQKLLDLQSETGQWRAALDTIDRFLAIEAEAMRRGAYFVAAAEIKRTHLKDEAGALDTYEEALDAFFADPPETIPEATRKRALEAFRAIDEIVTAQRDWKRLEQAYRRMIKRLPRTDPIALHLWHLLGEIYRTRLEHPESAIEAYEVAHALDAGKSPDRAAILAALYAKVGDKRPAKASEGAAKLVEVDPRNPDAYRALGRASMTAGKTDEAWCVARALVFLDQASSEEQALYRKHKAYEVQKAVGILDDDSWANVRHPDEDRAISAVFKLIWEAPVALRAGPPKSFELKAKEKLPLDDGSRVVAKIFRHASRVLNVPLPDVYVQPWRPGRLLLANCVEKGRLAPAIIVGRDLMSGYRDTEIAAAVGSMLALLRPSYYLKLALPTLGELEVALAAAASVAGKAIGRGEVATAAATLAPEIEKRLAGKSKELLAGLVERLPPQIDLVKWRNAVDATALRCALLVCGDLAATARMAALDPPAAGAPRSRERVEDLVAYSVSPAYFAIRRHLGVEVT